MPRAIRLLSRAAMPLVLLALAGVAGAQATDVDCTKCVNSKDLDSGAVTTYKLRNLAVTAPKIQDEAVTAAKIAPKAVGSAQINPVQVQKRVTGTCAVGSFVTAVAKNGSVTCESGTDPGDNTLYGYLALSSLAGGVNNAAFGSGALYSNTTGFNNAGFGFGALNANSTGHRNVAVGAFALFDNTSGHRNIAVGMGALGANTDGAYNTAVGGGGTLADNTTGIQNTGIGALALHMNDSGAQNTAVGVESLALNVSGNYNAAIGYLALAENVEGVRNIAVGTYAGQYVTGSHNIDIGNRGVAAESGTIRIGGANQTRTFVSGIRGTATGLDDAVTVVIDSNGQLGTISSSRRYKENIDDMGDLSDRLLGLRPVTFRYTEPYAGGEQPVQFGLIAEEVAEVFPELVVFNADREPETVKYRLLSALLLNELQKQDRAIEELNERLLRLETAR